MNGAQAEYQERRDDRRKRLTQAEAEVRLISNLRLAVFAVGLVIVMVAWMTGVSVLWLVPPGVVFFALVVAHERASRRAVRARRATEHYQAGLRRIEGSWPGHGNQRTDIAPDDHPYAADLDLFGPGSLFERLCMARTGAGVQTLAQWLLAPADPDTVRQRQAAVEDLSNRLDLREELALAGAALESEIDPAFLVAWGTRPPSIDPSRVRLAGALAWTMAIANVSAAVAWGWADVGIGPLALTLGATWVAGRPFRGMTDKVLFAVERPSRELAVVAEVLRRLEQQSFEAPRLQALRKELSGGETGAGASIQRLVRLVAWLDASRSGLFAPVGFALMWTLHFGIALEAWRAKHGPRIETWFAALGELEALASLSAYAFERENDVFPEFIEGPPCIDGQGLGHPLLAADVCICNPVTLGPDRRALMISGSNMSGKSTYLRAVGVAVVLAQAGAPVYADYLRLTPLRVGATLRVQDSLQAGASRFFAEIKRLRTVMDVAHEGPGLLFLLDEILHGTNSHDRRLGAEAVLAGLIKRDAIGLVTTHDLALAQAAEAMPAVVDNVHFADEIIDGKLVFDYRMKPGTVTTSNALDLMRAVGLDV
ncbi:MAG: DNA mismatch repair protein MutS [Nannocystaceae bacterium]|nr:DNA mismatch repair protein MutS [Nannocystaceae bacterium]